MSIIRRAIVRPLDGWIWNHLIFWFGSGSIVRNNKLYASSFLNSLEKIMSFHFNALGCPRDDTRLILVSVVLGTLPGIMILPLILLFVKHYGDWLDPDLSLRLRLHLARSQRIVLLQIDRLKGTNQLHQSDSSIFARYGSCLQIPLSMIAINSLNSRKIWISYPQWVFLKPEDPRTFLWWPRNALSTCQQ